MHGCIGSPQLLQKIGTPSLSWRCTLPQQSAPFSGRNTASYGSQAALSSPLSRPRARYIQPPLARGAILRGCRCQSSHAPLPEPLEGDGPDPPPAEDRRSPTEDLQSSLPSAMVKAMLSAPIAAAQLLDPRTGLPKSGIVEEGAAEDAGKSPINLKDLQKKFTAFRDRVYYGNVLPPVGSQQLSFARFMELLAAKKVKRITLMADGQVALVEVPVEGWASDYNTQRFDRQNIEHMYCQQRPEWQIEKYRFYVELPGDLYEDGYFMQLVKMNQPLRQVDGRREYKNLLREGQVTTELVVLDPNDGLVWLNTYIGQFIPIAALIGLRLAVGAGSWLFSKFGKKKLTVMEEMAEQYGKSRAKAFNVGDNAVGTGVRFSDVAGIDGIKDEIKVVMDMLLGAEEYTAIGATPFRGVLLEGPPGTGKTYLAKAMAGEAGIPFYSANGAEFVEMFAGVAAARIRDLFAQARATSPSIIFIDEIDAIGKARGGGGDSGTAEREQGLLQLLCEMDGFRRNDRVLVIGATNMATLLDDALLRPGRFDRMIYMGRPSTPNRLRILQVHAKDKPIDRTNNDAILNKVADMAIGYSGAELANLLNEAAILAVRKNQASIDLAILTEAMDKIKLGLRSTPLPNSTAKRRMAAVEAGRAVVLTLTPGIPVIQHMTIQPRGGVMGRILFEPLEFGQEGDQWHQLFYTADKLDDVRTAGGVMGTFDFCCGLLVPLYAARATEVVLYGREGATLSTAQEISQAGELAHYLVVTSNLHPAFRDNPLIWDMEMGGYPDPTTQGTAKQFEGFTVALQRAAFDRAIALVTSRLASIQAVAAELLADSNETVTGTRILELLQSIPAAASEHDFSIPLAGPGSLAQAVADAILEVPTEGLVSFREGSGGGAGVVGATSFRRAEALSQQQLSVADERLRQAAGVVAGQVDLEELTGPSTTRTRSQRVLEQVRAFQQLEAERAIAVQQYASSNDRVPFPPPPRVPDYAGPGVDDWVSSYTSNVVEV